MANTHRDSLAVGSSSGPREAPLPLETISTTKDSDLSDPAEAAANLPLMPPLETILPLETMRDTIATEDYRNFVKNHGCFDLSNTGAFITAMAQTLGRRRPHPLSIVTYGGSVEALARQVPLPSDSLAVGSALNSESDNRPNLLDEVESPPPSRRPNPPPGIGMSDVEDRVPSPLVEADAQESPQSDPLAVGSSELQQVNTRRREFLLSIKRSDPKQKKFSRLQVPRYVILNPDRGWASVENWHNIDLLNDIVPDASWTFNFEALKLKYRKHNGKEGSWIQFMNDRNITARHGLETVIRNNWYPTSQYQHLGPCDAWRLLFSLVHYAHPWRTLRWADVRNEYPNEEPFTKYIKHLLSRYEGEVALAWERWVYSGSGLPRDKALWDPQFATSAANRSNLAKMPREYSNYFGDFGKFGNEVDLLAIGNTTILRTRENEHGHWYLQRGGAFTLADLFAKFGDTYTVSELMFWYHHAPKLVKKRPHSWANADRRAAAAVRHEATGHYGHGKHNYGHRKAGWHWHSKV